MPKLNIIDDERYPDFYITRPEEWRSAYPLYEFTDQEVRRIKRVTNAYNAVQKLLKEKTPCLT